MSSHAFGKFKFGAAALFMLAMGTARAAECPSGKLCFWDYEQNNRRGAVADNNPRWSDFGWDNRADSFWNNGTSHNVCIFNDLNYIGISENIPRGKDYKAGILMKNRVSSNLWTRATSC